MSLTRQLAERLSGAVDEAAVDYLRVLTLTNGAAAIGDLGAFGNLQTRLPVDPQTPPGAAFVHAVHLHARTQDDFHPSGRVHVGAVTLAASLALSEHARGRLYECLSAGYETMCAIACVYAPDAQQRGYRPTGMFGPFGAAAAAGVALELDTDGIATALGLAAARSGGTNQSWLAGTDEWLLEVGYAARSGVEAALLAQAGVTSAAHALEGSAGWARAFFDDDGASRLVSALAGPRSYVREVAQKPYPVSGIAQVATRLACDAYDPAATFPDGVEVRMSEAEAQYPGSANCGPFHSRSDALMSVAFCVASGLSDGAVRIGRLDAPQELAEHVKRVEVVPDPQLAEGTATLAFDGNGSHHESRQTSAQILYAGWDDQSLNAAPLALRSEADIAAVASLRQALEPQYADATDIARLLRRQND